MSKRQINTANLALIALLASAGQVVAQAPGAVADELVVDELVVTARDRTGLLERAPSDSVFGLDKPLIETPRSASFANARR